MKVSLKTIEPYVTIPVGVEELVDVINKQLGGVEEIIDYTDKYKDVVIVRVAVCEPHPNADKLSVCMVDDAGVVADVERDEHGLVRVVCGAPNVKAGMLAAWLPPRSTVPSTYGTNDEFVLDARELRGIKSNGMLAASDELAIGTDHNGIVEIDENEWNPYGHIPTSGARFAEVYGLNDTVIEIENKMFTHRPDCFGQIGVAREIAGILGIEFRQPEWLSLLPNFAGSNVLELTVENKAPSLVPRFMAVAIRGVEVKPSSLWMQCELMRLGSKAINNIVDVTNYMMLMTGQPTHAYDYDTLRGAKLVARNAGQNETVTLLNGKTYKLDDDDIVIADGERAIGLAGIMGGLDTEVTRTTTNIVLEVATFDMYAVRKSSMRHGIFTDALTRFNKGQSPRQNPYIIGQLLSSMLKAGGGSQASNVYDESAKINANPSIEISLAFINARLGGSLAADDIRDLLARVGFEISEAEGDSLTITAPYWRTDIELSEDIVEEIGRLRGFDTLPRELPRRDMSPAPKNAERVFKQKLRTLLSRMGGNELLTYSFVHEKTMKRAGQSASDAFGLSNALSPDLHYYRLSLLPTLIEKAVMNGRAGYDETLLFEIGKTHNKTLHRDDDNGLPKEPQLIEGIYSSKRTHEGAAYFAAKRVVDQLVEDLGVKVVYSPLTSTLDHPAAAPFEPTRSAEIRSEDGRFMGIVGELRHEVHANFKLTDYAAAFSFELEVLQELYETSRRASRYAMLSRYPSISQDISLKTASTTPYKELYASVADFTAIDDVTVTLTTGTIYQPSDDASSKTTTFHVKMVSYERTLTDEDARRVVDGIVQRATAAVGAEQV